MIVRGQIEQIGSHGVYVPALNRKSIVIDVGANRGEFSREIIARFGCIPNLIEANPQLHASLVAQGLPSHFYAVADHDGEAQFNISLNPEGSSLLELPQASIYGATLERVITVPTVTLSTFLRCKRISNVDLLKLDIEGAEVAALECLTSEELTTFRQITVEFHDEPVFQFNLGEAVSLLFARLTKLGFCIISFNRPAHTNVLLLGPALGLNRLERSLLHTRYEILPFMRKTLGGLRRRNREL